MLETPLTVFSLTTWLPGDGRTGEMLLKGAATLWLAVLALYDARRRSVPHIGWVAGPGAAASLAAIWHGDWPLALSALTVVALSERRCLPRVCRRPALVTGLLAVAGLLTYLRPEALPGGLAVLGFWLMFELGWWAGADALAALLLALIWPDVGLLAALGGVHLAGGALRRTSWRWPRPLSPAELDAVGTPGLPALALTAGLRLIAAWVAGA